MGNETMDIKEVANYLKCSISSVRNLVRNKEIQFYRIGAKLYFRKSAIENWILQQEISNMQDNNFEAKIKPLEREMI